MSTPEHPHEALPKGYQVASVVAGRLPEELSFPLREEQFQTLCDGADGHERAWRDLCIGLLISGVIGLTGLIPAVDWPKEWMNGNWKPFACLAALFLIVAGALAGALICGTRMHKENTPYTRLKKKISGFFAAELPEFAILSPVSGNAVAFKTTVRGTVRPPGHPLHVLVLSSDKRWYLQGTPKSGDGMWTVECQFGREDSKSGQEYEILAIDGTKKVDSVMTTLPDGIVQSTAVKVSRK